MGVIHIAVISNYPWCRFFILYQLSSTLTVFQAIKIRGLFSVSIKRNFYGRGGENRIYQNL